jgi:hypothetical protein
MAVSPPASRPSRRTSVRRTLGRALGALTSAGIVDIQLRTVGPQFVENQH